MICFKCRRALKDPDELFRHFRYSHSFGPQTIYVCFENNCNQRFNRLSNFKKIVRHSKLNIVKNVQNFQNENEIVSINDVPQNVDITSNAPVECGNFICSENKSNESVSCIQDIPSISKCNREVATKFTIQMLCKSNITTKDALDIQTNVNEFVVQPLIDSVSNALTRDIFKLDKDYIKVSNILTNHKQMFTDCCSEYRLYKWLYENKLIEPLKIYNIHNELNIVHNLGESEFDIVNKKSVFMPIEFQFKKIFEKSDKLKFTLQNQNNLNSDCSGNLANFIQGDLWKCKIKNFGNNLVIPYFIYTDGFEINNSLGTHSTTQSMTAIYFSFPTSYSYLNLNEIFFAGFVNSKDLKCYGNDVCLCQFVNELKSFEENGITITTSDGQYLIHFILGLVQGDNLGVNEILGFVNSFSSKSFCRFCKSNKNVTILCTTTSEFEPRTINNYNVDILLNNSKITGVKSLCIFNSLKSFHVTSNYFVDYMHDMPGGVMHFVMSNVIHYLTEIKCLFSLEKLNLRKQSFNYGSTEIGNKSEAIKISDIKKKRFKMSAREMLTFVHFFTLMVGDLVPEDDEVWQFFCLFLKQNDILLSYSLSLDEINLLKVYIEKFNADYIYLFNTTLTPKFHILMHYSEIIKQSGPPRLYWSFLFETKHRETKVYAHNTTCRKNCPLTFAKKMQMKFTNYILHDKDSIISVKLIHKSQTHFNIIQNILNIAPASFNSYTELKYKGTIYKKNLYLTKLESEILQLFKIEEIAVVQNCLYVLALQCSIKGFSSHFEAYELNDNHSTTHFELISLDKFNGPPINIILTAKGKQMIRLKEFF